MTRVVRRTIKELGSAIRDREVSPVELTRECLARIEADGPKLNAFISVLADSAIEAARRAEQEIARGEHRGPLHGIPIGLKDIVDTAGVLTTAASGQYRDRVPSEDAEVVRRLRAAGCVILGKQNLHEFAYGGSSLVSFFGETRNPWDLSRLTGGSSGGSAASVASGLGLAAVGTDTAGSVRLPAAYCGVVGLKATYGRVSARGVVPLSWSYDHVGPIATCVHDAAVMLQAMAGYDPGDPSSVDAPRVDFTSCLAPGVRGLRVGVPRAFFCDDLDPEVADAFERAIGVLRGMHACVHDDVRLEVPTDRKLASAESYAFHQTMVTETPERYQAATLVRIKSAEKLLAPKVLRAARELLACRQAIRRVFDEVDVLVTPTVPIPPPSIARLNEAPDDLRTQENLMLRNTRPFNVWGIPSISVPCGFTRDGLPIGLQFSGPAWREDVVLQVANAYEQATDWHQRVPDPVAT